MKASDIRPFQSGDVFVGATLLNDPEDDHAGDGRIIQYDSNLNKKGELWIEGTRHLVTGLKFSDDGTLWAFEDHNIITVSPAGKILGLSNPYNRMFSNVCFASDGSLVFGEHAIETDIPDGMFKTVLPRMPDGRLGDGKAYRYSVTGQLLQVFDTKITKSMGRFLAVTCSVLSPDENRLIYVTETGDRVMQFDLLRNQQLDDLLILEGETMMQRMAFWVAYTPDGRLLVCCGDHIRIVDDETGALTKRIELGPFGFAAITACADNRHAYGCNFLTGDLVKVDMQTDTVVARASTGVERSAAGLAEYCG